MAARPDKALPVDKTAILQVIEPVYTFLSIQTQERDLDIYHPKEDRDNVPRYLPMSLDLWYIKVLEAFNAVSFLYRLFFTKQIAAYFTDLKADLQRALEFRRLLSGVVPEFGSLINDVLVLVSRP